MGTVAWYKWELDKLGVEYANNALKAELEDLYNQATE